MIQRKQNIYLQTSTDNGFKLTNILTNVAVTAKLSSSSKELLLDTSITVTTVGDKRLPIK